MTFRLVNSLLDKLGLFFATILNRKPRLSGRESLSNERRVYFSAQIQPKPLLGVR